MSHPPPCTVDYGTPMWYEIPAVDLDRAKAFYGTVFNWTFPSFPAGDDGKADTEKPTTAMFQMPDARIAKLGTGGTIMRVDADKHVKGHGCTRLYMKVDDVDETAARIEKAGGRMVADKEHPGADEGWIQLFEDVEGNIQGIYAGAAKQARELA